MPRMCVVLLCLVALAPAQDPPPNDSIFDRIDKALASPLAMTGGQIDALQQAMVDALGTNVKMAGVVEMRQVRVGLNAPGSEQKWVTAPRGSGGLGLKNKISRFEVQARPDDRTLAVTFVVAEVPLNSLPGLSHLPEGYVLEFLLSVELSYKNNRDFLSATADENAAVLRIADEVVDKAKQGTSPEEATRAAAEELRSKLSEIIDKSNFESIVCGTGTQISYRARPDGTAVPVEALSKMNLERLRPGQGGAKYTEHSIVLTVGNGLSGSLKYTSDTEFKPDAQKKGVANLVRQGDWSKLSDLAATKLSGVIDRDRVLKALDRLTANFGKLVNDASRMIALPEVGGVMIYFDPTLLETGAPPGDVARLMSECAKELDRGAKNFIVRSDAGAKPLTAVSLRRLIGSPADATLGELTRVRGYVVDPSGDVLLLGDTDASSPKINVDELVVAVRAVWKEGQFPFVSLDPDPLDFSAPQHPRIGGLPADLQQTEFVRIMLRADYEMKRINLGEDRVDVPGFESWYDILRRNKPDSEAMSRFWLYPVQPHAGDAWETQRDGRQIVVFDSNVQVLTERMKRVADYLVGTGELDPTSEAAAKKFTQYYRSIATQYPIFERLQALFDLAKVCAIWRSKGLRTPVLEQLAQRSVPIVPLKEERFDGIGPKSVEGTTLSISGGASARMRLTKRTLMATEALGGLSGVSDGRSTVVALPATTELPEDAVNDVSAELEINRGIAEFSDLKFEEADWLLTRALERDPELTQGWVYRGLARFEQGRVAEALKDVDRAVATEPALQGLRGMLRSYAGDKAGALSDAEAALKGYPDEESVLGWVAMTRLQELEFEAAEQVVDRLRTLAPMNPDGYNLATQLDLLSRMTPQARQARIEVFKSVPIPIAEAFNTGVVGIQKFDFDGAAEQLRRCLALIDKAGPNEPMEKFFLRERTLLYLANGLNMQSKILERLDKSTSDKLSAEAASCCDQVIQRHPEWPTGYILKGVREGSAGQARALFEKAVKGKNVNDPLMEDLTVLLGTDRALAYFGIVLFMQMGQSRSGSLDELKTYLDDLLTLMGTGPAGDILKALRNSLDHPNDKDETQKFLSLARSLPDTIPGDPATILMTGFFYSYLIMQEHETGDKKAKPETALKFLRMTRDIDTANWDVLTKIAGFRFPVSMMIGDYYGSKFKGDPRLEALRREISTGIVNPAAIREAIRKAYADAVALAASDGSRAVAGWAELTMRSQKKDVESEFLTLAQNFLRTAAPEVQEKLRPAVDAWERDLKGTGDRTSDMGEGLEAVVDSAETVVELRTVSLYADAMGMSIRMMGSEAPPEAANIRKVLSKLDAKFNARKIAPKKRPWQTQIGTTLAPASAVPEPMRTGGSSSKVILIVLGFSVAIVVATICLLRRSRRA